MSIVRTPIQIAFPLAGTNTTLMDLDTVQAMAPAAAHHVVHEEWDHVASLFKMQGLSEPQYTDAAAECLIGKVLGGTPPPTRRFPERTPLTPGATKFDRRQLRRLLSGLRAREIRLPFDRKDAAPIELATVRKLMPWAAAFAWDGNFVDLRNMLRRHGVLTRDLTPAAIQLLVGAVLNYAPAKGSAPTPRQKKPPAFVSTTLRPGGLMEDLDIPSLLQLMRNAMGVEFFLGLEDYSFTANPLEGGVRFGGGSGHHR